MKTPKRIWVACLLFGLALPILNSTSAKTKNKIDTSKKHHHKKAVDQFYFVFSTAPGAIYEVRGTGSTYSGTISQAYEACVDGLIVGGTASGTYSYNTSTDVMSISVYDTPTGSYQVEYSGTIASEDYSSSEIPLNCGR